jgi:hypothetical protein
LQASKAVVDVEEAAARMAASVRDAGALALSMFGRPIQNWTKLESSPVSDADIAVDRLLHERLVNEGSPIAWLSEESVDDLSRLDARYLWIVDPIDGTRAYLAGSPDWSVSVALVENGRPVAACLYAPVSDHRRSRRMLQRCADRGNCGCLARAIAHRRPAQTRRALDRAGPFLLGDAARSLAGAAIGAGRLRRLRRGDRGSQQSRLGPCGCRSFGARSWWRGGAGWGRQRRL